MAYRRYTLLRSSSLVAGNASSVGEEAQVLIDPESRSGADTDQALPLAADFWQFHSDNYKWWQSEVNNPNANVDEALLHRVAWDTLAMYFGLDMLALLGIASLLVVLWQWFRSLAAAVAVALAAFAPCSLLIVVAAQTVAGQAGRHRVWPAVVLELLLGALLWLWLASLAARDSLLEWRIIIGVPFFAPVSLAVVVVLAEVAMNAVWPSRDSDLYRSSLFRALTGTRYLKLTRRFHLFCLAKSLSVSRAPASREQPKQPKQPEQYTVGVVQVGQDDIPDTNLFIDGEDVEPDQYELTSVKLSGSGDTEELLGALFATGEGPYRFTEDMFKKVAQHSLDLSGRKIAMSRNTFRLFFSDLEIMVWIFDTLSRIRAEGPQRKPRRDMTGLVYVQSLPNKTVVTSPGTCSYHFTEPRPHMSFESSPVLLDDETTFAGEKDFQNHKFYPQTRTFVGTITWAPSRMAGAEGHRHRLVFDEGFTQIQTREVTPFPPNQLTEPQQLGKDLVYKRWVPQRPQLRGKSSAAPASVVDSNCPGWARLHRIDYKRGLREHWAVKLVFNAIVSLVLLLPCVVFFNIMINLQLEYCRSCKAGTCTINGGPAALGGELDDLCGNFFSFAAQVETFVHVSTAELLLLPVLILVWNLTNAIFITQADHCLLRRRYLRLLPVAQALVQQVTDVVDAMEDALQIPRVAEHWWLAFRRWSQGTDPALKACQPLVPEMCNMTDVVQENESLSQITAPLRDMMSKVSVEVFPLPLLSIPDSRQQFRSTWLQRVERLGLESRHFKVAIDVCVRYKETWEDLLANVLLKPEPGGCKLPKIFGQKGAQCQDGANEPVHVEKSIRVGTQMIPEGFCLTHLWAWTREGDLLQAEIVGEGKTLPGGRPAAGPKPMATPCPYTAPLTSFVASSCAPVCASLVSQVGVPPAAAPAHGLSPQVSFARASSGVSLVTGGRGGAPTCAGDALLATPAVTQMAASASVAAAPTAPAPYPPAGPSKDDVALASLLRSGSADSMAPAAPPTTAQAPPEVPESPPMAAPPLMAPPAASPAACLASPASVTLAAPAAPPTTSPVPLASVSYITPAAAMMSSAPRTSVTYAAAPVGPRRGALEQLYQDDLDYEPPPPMVVAYAAEASQSYTAAPVVMSYAVSPSPASVAPSPQPSVFADTSSAHAAPSSCATPSYALPTPDADAASDLLRDAVDLDLFKDQGYVVRLFPKRTQDGGLELWTDDCGEALTEFYLRFELSEQYFKAKHSPGKNFYTSEQLVSHVTKVLASDDLESTENRSLEDRKEEEYPRRLEANVCCLMLGNQHQSAALLRHTQVLGQWLVVLVLSLLLPVVPPLWRLLADASPAFPEPFAPVLVANALSQAVAFCWFLVYLTKPAMQLRIVNRLLYELRQRTLDPSGERGQAATGSSKRRAAEAGDTQSPFDLYVNARITTYVPNHGWWNTQWDQVRQRVENWHLCESYLRVFVSTVRLTAQAMLLAAAVVLLLLLVLSFYQAWSGKGALNIDKEGLLADLEGDIAAAVQSGIDSGQELLREAAEEASRATVAAAQRAAGSEADGGGGGAGAPAAAAAAAAARRLDAAAAGLALREALRPFSEALLEPARQQLASLVGSLEGRRRLSARDYFRHMSLGDTRKLTQTQALSVVAIVALAYFTVPLVYRVAKTNDYFAQHAGLLVTQKEKHQQRQAYREQGTVKNKMLVQGLRGNVRIKDDPNYAKMRMFDHDAAMAHYEKAMDMAIESSRNGAKLFPLTLCGFMINTGILVSWIFLAAVPLVEQVQSAAPGLALSACQRLTETTAFQQVSAGAESAVGGANTELNVNGTDSEVSFNLYQFFNYSVCTPLVTAAASVAEVAGDAALKRAQSLNGTGSAGRRLTPAAELLRGAGGLSAAVGAWWDAQLGPPQQKLQVSVAVLQEFGRNASRWLAAAPQSVRAAHAARGAAGAVERAVEEYQDLFARSSQPGGEAPNEL